MVSPKQIPQDLMQQLHAATERFHAHRQQLEASQGDSDYSHQEHVARATEQLNATERELEEINRKIHDAMSGA